MATLQERLDQGNVIILTAAWGRSFGDSAAGNRQQEHYHACKHGGLGLIKALMALSCP